MSATVRADERGFDSSFSHPPVAVTTSEGFTFRVGYISRPPASPDKNITPTECADTLNAGQRLLLVWEMNSARATLGAAFGTIDGLAAKQEAQLRGQPLDVPILFADDTGTTVANLPKKIAYMQAAAVACAPYPIGIYGGVKILAPLAGLWVIGWVPITAWSWSVNLTRKLFETDASYNARGRAAATQAARDVGAHCLQHQGYYIDNTWAVDPNEAIADFPAWGHPDPTPTPIPGDDDMAIATNAEPHPFTDGNTYPPGVVKWVLGVVKRHLQEEEWQKVYGSAAGAALSNAALAAIPDYTPAVAPGPPSPATYTINLTGTATP